MTVIGGFVATAILFLALPFTQLLNAINPGGNNSELADYSMPPPPPPPAEPPPPQDEEDKEDKPELDTKPPPLSLAQLELGDYAASDANYKTSEELRPVDE